MKLRGLCLALMVLVLALGVMNAVQASVISRDVAYWYWQSPGVIDTYFNPNSQWISANKNKLVIKVQQTVYDERETANILAANLPKTAAAKALSGKGLSSRAISSKSKSLSSKKTLSLETAVPTGFLYSYAVTNLGWSQPTGLTGFAVDWGGAPVLYCTTSRTQTPVGWSVSGSTSGIPCYGPKWEWTNPSKAGLRIGSTVGGFWAVAQTGRDGVVSGWTAGKTTGAAANSWILSGKTTGPIVPEPAGLAALLIGTVSLGAFRLRRR